MHKLIILDIIKGNNTATDKFILNEQIQIR